MRSAIARAVSSGSGLEKWVDRKVVSLSRTELLLSRDTASIFKSKLAPRHNIGWLIRTSATSEGTVKSALASSLDRRRTKKGTAFPLS